MKCGAVGYSRVSIAQERQEALRLPSVSPRRTAGGWRRDAHRSRVLQEQAVGGLLSSRAFFPAAAPVTETVSSRSQGSLVILAVVLS